MNSKLLKYLALPSMLLMSACSTTNANQRMPLDTFHEQLAHNYKNSGDSKGNTFDVKSKRAFAKKSAMLMCGKEVHPMMISKKCQDNELREARMMLEKALSEKKMSAKRLADMQFYYDCWASGGSCASGACLGTKKNMNMSSACKEKFMELAMADECKSADNVYFPINGHCLIRATNTEVIKQFAEMAKNTKERILVVGSADKSGTAQYNKALSLKRAKVVADQLVAHGISKNRIKLIALGESKARANDEPEMRSAGLFIENEEVMKCFRQHHHAHGCSHKHAKHHVKKHHVKKHHVKKHKAKKDCE
jgi:outer membrane protein OmpA-like peptidoglycan-associated protein